MFGKVPEGRLEDARVHSLAPRRSPSLPLDNSTSFYRKKCTLETKRRKAAFGLWPMISITRLSRTVQVQIFSSRSSFYNPRARRVVLSVPSVQSTAGRRADGNTGWEPFSERPLYFLSARLLRGATRDFMLSGARDVTGGSQQWRLLQVASEAHMCSRIPKPSEENIRREGHPVIISDYRSIEMRISKKGVKEYFEKSESLHRSAPLLGAPPCCSRGRCS